MTKTSFDSANSARAGTRALSTFGTSSKTWKHPIVANSIFEKRVGPCSSPHVHFHPRSRSLAINTLTYIGMTSATNTVGGLRPVPVGKTETSAPRLVHEDPEKQLPVPLSRGDTSPSDPESKVSDAAGTELPVEEGADDVQEWCRPRGNVLRLAFAFLSFFNAGMNDAAIGVGLSPN